MSSPLQMARPQRWDVPFGEGMTEADVKTLLEYDVFAKVDQNRFPASIPLHGILANDTRILPFHEHQIVVREGDYGNSAFLILRGAVKVILGQVSGEALGRSTVRRRNWWESLSRLWTNDSEVEVRKVERRSRGLRRSAAEKAIFLQDAPTVLDQHATAVLAAGEVFGEIAALGRMPRTATVIAAADTQLLEIRWQGLRELRRYAPQWREHIDRIYRERSLLTHLREAPLFADLDPQSLQELADQTRFETYGSFDWYGSYKSLIGSDAKERLSREPIVASEGDFPNGLILIRSGFGRLSQRYNHGEKTVGYLGKGQAFGLPEICHNFIQRGNKTFTHTLRALGYLDILFVPTPVVEKYLLSRLSPMQIEALSAPASGPVGDDLHVDLSEDDLSGRLDTGLLEALVENRTINGAATMLIDLERCVRCDDCVRACASTHNNNPRFVRHGRQKNGVMVVQACMHCVDPVCMIGCPTGAIHRDPGTGQVLINDATCIGCETCANACPYDNIQMVSANSPSGEPLVDQHTFEPIRKATKCDLCAGQSAGPACVRACPHDALIRLDMQQLDRLANWLDE